MRNKNREQTAARMDTRNLFVPDHLYIELTNQCNMKCKHCYLAASPQGDVALSSSLVRRALDEFVSIGGLSVAFSGGEPLLHPDCLGLAGYAKAQSLDVVIVTNGVLLHRDVVDRLTDMGVSVALSLDGINEKTSDAIRGPGSFAKAMRALDTLTAAHASDRSIICFTPTKQNVDELMPLTKMLARRGIRRCSLSLLEERGRGIAHADELSMTVGDKARLLVQLAFLLSDPGLNLDVDAGHLRYFFLRLLTRWEGDVDPIEGTLRMSPVGGVYLTAYSDDEAFFLGDFRLRSLRQLLRSDAIRHLFLEIYRRPGILPKCEDCCGRSVCAGGSRVRAYAKHKNFDETDDFCEAKRIFLERWFRALCGGVPLAKEKWKDQPIAKGGVQRDR